MEMKSNKKTYHSPKIVLLEMEALCDSLPFNTSKGVNASESDAKRQTRIIDDDDEY